MSLFFTFIHITGRRKERRHATTVCCMPSKLHALHDELRPVKAKVVTWHKAPHWETARWFCALDSAYGFVLNVCFKVLEAKADAQLAW